MYEKSVRHNFYRRIVPRTRYHPRIIHKLITSLLRRTYLSTKKKEAMSVFTFIVGNLKRKIRKRKTPWREVGSTESTYSGRKTRWGDWDGVKWKKKSVPRFKKGGTRVETETWIVYKNINKREYRGTTCPVVKSRTDTEKVKTLTSHTVFRTGSHLIIYKFTNMWLTCKEGA